MNQLIKLFIFSAVLINIISSLPVRQDVQASVDKVEETFAELNKLWEDATGHIKRSSLSIEGYDWMNMIRPYPKADKSIVDSNSNAEDSEKSSDEIPNIAVQPVEETEKHEKSVSNTSDNENQDLSSNKDEILSTLVINDSQDVEQEILNHIHQEREHHQSSEIESSDSQINNLDSDVSVTDDQDVEQEILHHIQADREQSKTTQTVVQNNLANNEPTSDSVIPEQTHSQTVEQAILNHLREEVKQIEPSLPIDLIEYFPENINTESDDHLNSAEVTAEDFFNNFVPDHHQMDTENANLSGLSIQNLIQALDMSSSPKSNDIPGLELGKSDIRLTPDHITSSIEPLEINEDDLLLAQQILQEKQDTLDLVQAIQAYESETSEQESHSEISESANDDFNSPNLQTTDINQEPLYAIWTHLAEATLENYSKQPNLDDEHFLKMDEFQAPVHNFQSGYGEDKPLVWDEHMQNLYPIPQQKPSTRLNLNEEDSPQDGFSLPIDSKPSSPILNDNEINSGTDMKSSPMMTNDNSDIQSNPAADISTSQTNPSNSAESTETVDPTIKQILQHVEAEKQTSLPENHSSQTNDPRPDTFENSDIIDTNVPVAPAAVDTTDNETNNIRPATSPITGHTKLSNDQMVSLIENHVLETGDNSFTQPQNLVNNDSPMHNHEMTQASQTTNNISENLSQNTPTVEEPVNNIVASENLQATVPEFNQGSSLPVVSPSINQPLESSQATRPYNPTTNVAFESFNLLPTNSQPSLENNVVPNQNTKATSPLNLPTNDLTVEDFETTTILNVQQAQQVFHTNQLTHEASSNYQPSASSNNNKVQNNNQHTTGTNPSNSLYDSSKYDIQTTCDGNLKMVTIIKSKINQKINIDQFNFSAGKCNQNSIGLYFEKLDDFSYKLYISLDTCHPLGKVDDHNVHQIDLNNFMTSYNQPIDINFNLDSHNVYLNEQCEFTNFYIIDKELDNTHMKDSVQVSVTNQHDVVSIDHNLQFQFTTYESDKFDKYEKLASNQIISGKTNYIEISSHNGFNPYEMIYVPTACYLLDDYGNNHEVFDYRDQSENSKTKLNKCNVKQKYDKKFGRWHMEINTNDFVEMNSSLMINPHLKIECLIDVCSNFAGNSCSQMIYDCNYE